jgi:hypothetical protein
MWMYLNDPWAAKLNSSYARFWAAKPYRNVAAPKKTKPINAQTSAKLTSGLGFAKSGTWFRVANSVLLSEPLTKPPVLSLLRLPTRLIKAKYCRPKKAAGFVQARSGSLNPVQLSDRFQNRRLTNRQKLRFGYGGRPAPLVSNRVGNQRSNFVRLRGRRPTLLYALQNHRFFTAKGHKTSFLFPRRGWGQLTCSNSHSYEQKLHKTEVQVLCVCFALTKPKVLCVREARVVQLSTQPIALTKPRHNHLRCLTRATLESAYFSNRLWSVCAAIDLLSADRRPGAEHGDFCTAIAASMKQKISTSVVAKTSRVYMFSNRVDFIIILEKSGVKWDQGYRFPKFCDAKPSDLRSPKKHRIAKPERGSGKLTKAEAGPGSRCDLSPSRSRAITTYGTLLELRSSLHILLTGSGWFVRRLTRSTFVQASVNKDQSASWANGQSQVGRFRPAANLNFAESGAVARATTDGYCDAVNTLQWFVRLSMEDQLLCLACKSGQPDTTYWKIVNKRRYNTIRPLLNLSRGSLTTLCKDLRLPVYPDKSNKAVQYSRNRLREQILPAIKLFLNPQIEDALFKLAELLTQDFFVVSHLVNTGRRLTKP